MSKKAQIRPLTSLRMLFAGFVFCSHLGFLGQSASELSRSVYHGVFAEGYIGVGFFFVLSGFILAYNYEGNAKQLSKAPKSFYLHRIARIYPLHLVTLLLSLPLSLVENELSVEKFGAVFVSQLVLMQSFLPDHDFYFSFNQPAWSLSAELFFYALFPLLLGGLAEIASKASRTFFLPAGLIIGWLVVGISVNADAPDAHYWFYISPFVRLLDFLLGMSLYFLWREFEVAEWVNFHLLEVLSVGVFVLFFFFHRWVPTTLRYGSYYWFPICLLIFVFAHQKGGVSRGLSGRVPVFLGKISFGFYLFHHLVLRYLPIVNNKLLGLENEWLMVLLALVLTLLMSAMSWMLIEKPILQRSRRRYRVRSGDGE